MKINLVYLFLVINSLCFSQNNSLIKKHSNLNGDLAIHGYDPVSYFYNVANKGKDEYSFVYNEITYLFSSEKNMKEFKNNQAHFVPQYGGWCAYAMAKGGKKVDINPKTFKIIDGKLFLFYNAYFNNTLKQWNKNEGELKQDAYANWHSIIK